MINLAHQHLFGNNSEKSIYIESVAFSSDGRTLATATGYNDGHSGRIRMDKYQDGNKFINLWDIQTGKLVKILKGHKGYVESITFSPSGNTLASGSGDKTSMGQIHTKTSADANGTFR